MRIQTMETISAEEHKRRLISRAKNGDASAWSDLVRGHERVVFYFARRFYLSNASVDLDDLVQQGFIGLLKAVEKFDLNRYSKGKRVRFVTYAAYWIQH